MKYSKPIIVSIIIHLAVGIMLLPTLGEGDGDSQNGGNGDFVNLKINPPIKEEEKMNNVKPKEGTLLVQKIEEESKKQDDEKCEESYYGIGIDVGFSPCQVLHVYPGYPAHQNGIKQDDVILSPSCLSIKAESDSLIDMVISRDGKKIALTFKRGKICGKK